MPDFDPVSYLMGKQAGSGGGGDITVESKSISANGTYTAPAGKAYSPVAVNVPNSYAASDEGKVVSNGALVSQTSDTVTANDTYDTTLINSLTVNVSGGGDGVLTWTQLATVDCSQNGGNIELTNLDDYTALFFIASGVHNGSTTASSYALDINDIQVNSTGIVAIAKSGTTQYQQSYVKFNGLFWEFYIPGSTVNQGYLRPVNLQGLYHYVLNVGKATSIKLTAPVSTYQATSGTITIYGGK